VTLYLLYTLYEADFELRRAGTFYTDLSLPVDATDREVKSRFRRMAALYHPDKVADNTADANAYFVHLKTVSDALLDPARRFAYDRFGPEVVGWQHCATVRDYVARGAQVVLPYYGVAALGMYVFGLLGYLDWGRYERWLVLVVMLVFELHVVTRPTPPAMLSRVVNPLLGLLGRKDPYLPFQLVSLARKASLTLYIAFSQVGPLLSADTREGVVQMRRDDGNNEQLLHNNLERLEANAKALDTEAERLMGMEVAPFLGDEESLRKVQAKMKHWLVQNTIHTDPMVRDAMGRQLQRRRMDAPTGARGTR
jgi:hypothetical protein